ncbi:hypothetical protein, partial [Bacillus velezensis]
RRSAAVGSDGAPAGEHLKAKTPRVHGAIGKAPEAPRREISAAHRSCGGSRIREPARRRLFCVQGRKRAALAAAEGDPLRPATASAHGALLRAKREKARRAYHGAPEPL